jgi:hypothetical protein
MATINVPHKVRRGGTIKVEESRDAIRAIIASAKRRGVALVTLTEAGGARAHTFDIKYALINSVED